MVIIVLLMVLITDLYHFIDCPIIFFRSTKGTNKKATVITSGFKLIS